MYLLTINHFLIARKISGLERSNKVKTIVISLYVFIRRLKSLKSFPYLRRTLSLNIPNSPSKKNIIFSNYNNQLNTHKHIHYKDSKTIYSKIKTNRTKFLISRIFIKELYNNTKMN